MSTATPPWCRKDAAHTARDNARTAAADRARRAAEQAAREAAGPAPVPTRHAARSRELTTRQDQLREVHDKRRQHLETAQTAREELTRPPAWRRGRRHELHQTITAHQGGFETTFPEAARLDRAIDTLTRQVELDTRQREHQQRQRATRTVPARTDQDAYLAPAATDSPTARRARPGDGRQRGLADRIEAERVAEQNRRIHHER